MLEYSEPSRSGTTVTLGLRGDMTGERWTGRLAAFLDEHFISDSVWVVRLDLSEVGAIDLAGIAMLVGLARQAETRSKRLVVMAPSQIVEDHLVRAGMSTFLITGRFTPVPDRGGRE